MKFGEEKTVRRETLFEGKIISLHVDDVELPNGLPSKREIVTHPGAVAIIAITEDGKIVLVEQYRKALERAIIEIPAGKIDAGETLENCALRELEEETGYLAHKLEHVQSFATSPGFADEIIHVYLASNLEKLSAPREGDEDEFVRLHEVALEEALQWMKDGKIYDAKTAFALLYVQQQFPYTK